MMINAWHLLWIMPIAGMAGFMIAALFVIGDREDEE